MGDTLEMSADSEGNGGSGVSTNVTPEPVGQPESLPPEFLVGGIAAGIKDSGNLDLALFASKQPCLSVGVLTQNRFRAASIERNSQLLPGQSTRAILVNSGNANACTGDLGECNNNRLAELAAEQLGCQAEQILTLSTGVIGEQLPMEKVEATLPALVKSCGSQQANWQAACHAILTTDQGPKARTRTIRVMEREYSIFACAKGAGMIGPRMATMLGIVITDFPLPASIASSVLKRCVDQSFNCISVEDHTSTNDAVLLLASQQEGLEQTDPEHAGPALAAVQQFEKSLGEICVELAKMIPADGEGASHLIEIRVSGARNGQQADQVARQVANSNLVKTAITGADPNWGRIMSAVGNTEGVELAPTRSSLQINGSVVFQHGEPVDFDRQAISDSMRDSFETQIEIDLGVPGGTGTASHWTSDLNEHYLRFNTDYTT